MCDFHLQSEYVQLCKTLYSLLQDSPDEEDLLIGMGKVAHDLLRIGEDNVRMFSSTAGAGRLGCSPQTAESSDFTPHRTTSPDPSLAEKENASAQKTKPSSPRATEGELTQSVLPSLSDLEARNDKERFAEGEGGIGSECNDLPKEADSRPSITADSVEPAPISADPVESPSSIADSPDSPKKQSLESSFDKAMADAAELEEKWFLTFEQFVGSLQREPFLCQFFAEQNSIDLSGTNVDPVLNPYTRTILATSP